jgi:hypothetical protein
MDWLDRIPWYASILLCLTLGLAPFTPPHVVEKLGMLYRGELTRAIDWLDLLLHSAPWLLLLLKIAAGLLR